MCVCVCVLYALVCVRAGKLICVRMCPLLYCQMASKKRSADGSGGDEVSLHKRLRTRDRCLLASMAFEVWCNTLTYLNPWDHAAFLFVLTPKLWPMSGAVELIRRRWILPLVRIHRGTVTLCGQYFYTQQTGPSWHSTVEQKWMIGDTLHRGGDEPAVVRTDGLKEWWFKGQRHREGDRPAYIDADGNKRWYRRGRLCRDGDQPAVINADGGQEWYKNGLIHRDGDKPAIIHANGDQFWYVRDNLHRDGDQPAVIWQSGHKAWYKNGQYHRDGDKPAYVDSDIQVWYRNGQIHRDGDQPAVIETDGTLQWYRYGVPYRDGGQPAYICKQFKEWYQDGKPLKRLYTAQRTLLSLADSL